MRIFVNVVKEFAKQWNISGAVACFVGLCQLIIKLWFLEIISNKKNILMELRVHILVWYVLFRMRNARFAHISAFEHFYSTYRVLSSNFPKTIKKTVETFEVGSWPFPPPKT